MSLRAAGFVALSLGAHLVAVTLLVPEGPDSAPSGSGAAVGVLLGSAEQDMIAGAEAPELPVISPVDPVATPGQTRTAALQPAPAQALRTEASDTAIAPPPAVRAESSAPMNAMPVEATQAEASAPVPPAAPPPSSGTGLPPVPVPSDAAPTATVPAAPSPIPPATTTPLAASRPDTSPPLGPTGASPESSAGSAVMAPQPAATPPAGPSEPLPPVVSPHAPERSLIPPARPERPAPPRAASTERRPAAAAPTAARRPAAPAAGNAPRDARRGADQAAPRAQSQSRPGRSSPAPQAGAAGASDYAAAVMRRIRAVPAQRNLGRGAALVAFTIGPSGALTSVGIARSSRNAALDRAAVAHIRRAAPFPRPPAGANTRFSFEFVGR